MRTVAILAHGASALVRHIGQISAWLGLALVCVVSFNVLARYLFGFGSVALQEAEWHLMSAAALLGMSYGLNQGGEVRVDIFYARMSSRRQALIDTGAALLLMAISLIIAWLSLAYVQSSYSINEGSPDPGGLGYRYLLKSVLPIAFALLALQAVAMLGEALQRLLARRP
ncbi:C4-dicarboxylate ABC transporter permease [Brevirhabdus pacifica]|uniref:TRAP transporter small permease protein n=1 Tax=Brevirhabdus pacifica TaxID=1267768 RepID=A0A1U7DM53_9RHOB|nr:TRAP transporter small permease subunit [Brevirhabdus pacifica]APX90973.1 C4-dicarboxylate ABC transporter permease [Brevirhabdus pacifica]PJJ86301.1 TRAP-type mannitol/chloroaromatic compound transport system permease small subunit [Brevirhabdus pacifica]